MTFQTTWAIEKARCPHCSRLVRRWREVIDGEWIEFYCPYQRYGCGEYCASYPKAMVEAARR